ncbi:MAG: DUF4351 domain-containing protein [Gammaproteobacteria bacterium]|nr:DUF4351 domain-containing protein [Gammaproteobacteria bacterium]
MAGFFQRARDEGRVEGRVDGERAVLTRLLRRRFGRLPPAVEERVHEAPASDLEAGRKRARCAHAGRGLRRESVARGRHAASVTLEAPPLQYLPHRWASTRSVNSRRAPGWSSVRPGVARPRRAARPTSTSDRWGSAGRAGSRTRVAPARRSGRATGS